MDSADARAWYDHIKFLFRHVALQSKVIHCEIDRWNATSDSESLKYAVKDSLETIELFASDQKILEAAKKVDQVLLDSFAPQGKSSTAMQAALQCIHDFQKDAYYVGLMRDENLELAVQNLSDLTAIILRIEIELHHELLTECGRVVRWIEEHARFLANCNAFAPTELQWEILKAIEGRAMTADSLVEELHCGRHTLFGGKTGAGGLNELMQRGIIQNDRKQGGYYRPDAPPRKAH